MIRLTFLLRRNRDLSLEKFQQYWREEHGPLVAGFGQRLNILRYVQVHRLEDELNEAMAKARGGMEPPYDGVAELWWESEESLASVVGREEGGVLLEDERRFIDLANSPLWLSYEYPQINPLERIVAHERSGVVKLHFPLRAPAGLALEEAQLYWRTRHGPLIRRHAAAMGMLRYQQVHRFPSELENALREPRGTATEPYMGYAEVWLDRSRAPSSPEARAANRRAIDDERKFIDFRRSSMWIGKEHFFIDRL